MQEEKEIEASRYNKETLPLVANLLRAQHFLSAAEIILINEEIDIRHYSIQSQFSKAEINAVDKELLQNQIKKLLHSCRNTRDLASEYRLKKEELTK